MKLNKGVTLKNLADTNNRKNRYLKDNPKNEEKKFLKFFVHNTNTALPRASYIDHEVNLIPAIKILTGQVRSDCYDFENNTEADVKGFGRIDVMFRYKGINYCAEIKYQKCSSSDFWNSLKILGYTEYYKWQISNSNYKPAILIPSHSIGLESQIVAGRLGLAIFTIKERDGEYFVKLLDNRPYWKQTDKKSEFPLGL
jgi:hypothetical protein